MGYRVAVAGAGFIASWWIPALLAHDDVEIVGLADPDATRVSDTVEAHGLGCATAATLPELIGRVDADVVVSLTPPRLHRETVEIAFAAGCDVLTEKPLASTFEDALAMVELAERSGRALSVMQNRRFVPGLRRLAEGIASGAIGTPFMWSADMFMGPRHGAGYLPSMRHPLLEEMSIHTFDQALFLAGTTARSVVCTELDPEHSWYNGPAAVLATFELANGAVFSYRGNWVAEGFATSYDSVWRASGSAGSAIWDGAGEPECETPLPRTEEFGSAPVERTRWRVDDDASGHERCLEEMLAALREGRPAETDARSNLNSLAMVFAAERSAAERRWVDLSEVYAP
jgi:predicted dehydrogenase